MKIISLKLNNIYSFHNFDLNLRVKRKVNNIYREEFNEVSRVNVKDINVIIGPNSSGKTTLGKVILLSQRVLSGISLTKNELNCVSKTGKASIQITYVKTIDNVDVFYDYNLEFKDGNPTIEILKSFKLTSGKTYSSEKFSIVDEHKFEIETLNFQSIIMNRLVNEHTEASSCGYSHNHSIYSSNKIKLTHEQMPVELISNFLQTIDKTIVNVTKINDSGDINGKVIGFQIKFRNNDDIIISGDDLLNLSNRLSHGTIEAIQFLYKLLEIKSGFYNTIYIDEQLTHIHSDLEKELLSIAINILPLDAQLFYTSHNVEVLNMNLPISCYTILIENEEGYPIAISPEEYLPIQNDRNNMYKNLENNTFGTVT